MSNPNNYWFKRKRYGWGFTPVTWQGWLVIVDFIILAIGGAILLMPGGAQQTSSSEILRFAGYLTVLTGIVLYISLARGPKPRWRWGKKPDDNPSEDI